MLIWNKLRRKFLKKEMTDKAFKGEIHDWGILGLSTSTIDNNEVVGSGFDIKITGTVYGMDRNDVSIITSRLVKVDGDFIETSYSIYLLVGECKNKDSISKDVKEKWFELGN